MLTESQISDIINFLEKAKRPLFFFDDDHDGLASFLLIYKKYQKGYGIPVKSSPLVDDIYIRKTQEYKPDFVFVLDRPVLSQDAIDKISVPVIWIDHHEPLQRDNVYYFNSMVNDKHDSRPTSYWVYKVANEKKDLWIALIGIIGDYYIPEFVEDFEYKELFDGKKEIQEILFESRFGKLIKIFSFSLKGKTSDVKKNISILSKIESPFEILNQESPRGKYILKRFEGINKEYEKLLKKALSSVKDDEIYVFKYPSTKMSFTGELSNELLYRLDKKILIIGREIKDEIRLSIRSKKVKILPILKKSLESIRGYGGGHDFAVGANIKKDDFYRFLDNIRKNLIN